MRHAWVISLSVISLVAACSGDETSVRQRFLAQSSVSVLFDTWVRAVNNRDRDSVTLLYHHARELRVIRADGSVTRGWNEEREAQAQFFDSVARVNFLGEALEIEVVNQDVVLTTFRHSLDVERSDGERDPTVSGVGTIVWLRDSADDQWKIHILHLSAR